MDQQQLEEIKKRNAARTPGKWQTDDDEGITHLDDPIFVVNEKGFAYSIAHVDCNYRGDSEWVEISNADKQFIARASEDIPALLAEVERLQAIIQEYKLGLRSSGII